MKQLRLFQTNKFLEQETIFLLVRQNFSEVIIFKNPNIWKESWGITRWQKKQVNKYPIFRKGENVDFKSNGFPLIPLPI